MHHLPNVFDTMPMPREQPREQEELGTAKPSYDHPGEETMRTGFAPYVGSPA